MCAHCNDLLTSLTIIYAYVNGGNTHFRKYLRVINMSHHTRDFFFPNTHARAPICTHSVRINGKQQNSYLHSLELSSVSVTQGRGCA